MRNSRNKRADAQLNACLALCCRFMMRAALRASLEGKSSASGRRFIELLTATLQDAEGRSKRDYSLETKLKDVLQDITVLSRDWIDDAEVSSDATATSSTGSSSSGNASDSSADSSSAADVASQSQ
jgi:type II secretory pathway pseudopilin PulG